MVPPRIKKTDSEISASLALPEPEPAKGIAKKVEDEMVEAGAPLEIGKTIKIGGKHNLKRISEKEYSCSCPSWRFQLGAHAGKKYRSCKHVEA